ncbi:MAG: beta-lactamase family protein [Bacteroidia bacterium]
MKQYSFIFILAFAALFFSNCGGDDFEVPADFSLDEEVQRIMEAHQIPGVQLAIVKNERLVERKSFGFANVELNEPVNDSSLFRIASISKPITVAGFLILNQRNELDLDAKVFGENGVLGTKYGKAPYSSKIESITVRHLIEHKAGGWPNDSNDPMFFDNSLSHEELISFVIDSIPLIYEPGTQVLYSNFGYCLLGRVIEEVSGLDYHLFIKQNLLEPSGINTMEIGSNTIEEMLKNEVKYYNNQFDYSPYKPNVSRFDANGGWVASSTDLLKLMVRLDRNPNKADIIDTNTLSQTYLGNISWGHSGALPGTCTYLEKYNDEFAFAFLCNGNSYEYETATNELIEALQSEIYIRESWPDVDFFDE